MMDLRNEVKALDALIESLSQKRALLDKAGDHDGEDLVTDVIEALLSAFRIMPESI